MRVQPNTLVKLLPSYGEPYGTDHPIWGGRHGLVGGIVEKVFTHDHDKKKHTAKVLWYNKTDSVVVDEHLDFLTDSERQFSEDFIKHDGISSYDIFVLVRMSSGKMVLSYIESTGSGASHTVQANKERYFVGMTKHAIEKFERPDEDLLNVAASYPDWVEKTCDNLYEAQCAVYKLWDIPCPISFYHPLPTFKTICTAVNNAPPETGPAISMFRLPSNVCDYMARGNAA